MSKLTYNEDKTELTKFIGAKTMNKLDKVLNVTEKETSEIIKVDRNISLPRLFHAIERKEMELYSNQGSKKLLQRVILDSGNIIKLESKDNGTSVVYVIDENDSKLIKLESKLKVFCKLHNLLFRKIEC